MTEPSSTTFYTLGATHYDESAIVAMYQQYMQYCRQMRLIPDYVEEEFYYQLKVAKFIPESFLQNLVYHRDLTAFLNKTEHSD